MRKRTPVEAVLRITREALSKPNVRGVCNISAPGPMYKSQRLPEPNDVRPPANGVFHLTHRLSRLCADIAAHIPEFGHIDMQRVLVTFVRCRNQQHWGLQAKLIPLRFDGGARTQVKRGWLYRIQQIYVDNIELSYVMSVYLPRFLDQKFDEKLITLFHELYHISPDFDGTIRRFEGRCAHNGSQQEYDRRMASFVREYLSLHPPRELYDFLRLSCSELQSGFGEIVGVHIPAPKLVPVRKQTDRAEA